jgi:prokaryotic ubiquitin-like protein Pup
MGGVDRCGTDEKTDEKYVRSGVMAEQQRKTKAATERSTEQVEAVAAPTERGEKIKAELDDLLDEIDDVLETNAEEFVKSYVQKGGE